MKVVFLHPPLYPVNYQFCNFLGKHVELVVYQYGNSPSDHPQWTNEHLASLKNNFKIKIFGSGIDSIKNQFNYKILTELNKDKPDIVISVAFWFPSLFAVLLKSILNFKFIIVTDAIKITENKNSVLREKIRKYIASKTDRFISSSELTSSYLKEITMNNNINLSIQTIDVNTWKKEISQLENKDYLKEKLLLPKDKTIILGVGNFYYKKNWLSAIKSMINVEEAVLILIGSGEEKVDYLNFIKQESLENKVIILDRKEKNELKEYFKTSDLFILPSILETFGFVVVEALASGLPVLCSKYTGASSLIINSYNGIIIDSKEDFSIDIKNAINNLEYMRPNAYKSIENLTLENRADEFYSIFKDVLI